MAAFRFSGPPESLEQAVGEAVGAASTCWTNLGDAGVFKSEQAVEVVNGLVGWINENYIPR